MSDLVQELPPDGAGITHVLSGYEGKVGRLDMCSRMPVQVRIDKDDGKYCWFPLSECRWLRGL